MLPLENSEIFQQNYIALWTPYLFEHLDPILGANTSIPSKLLVGDKKRWRPWKAQTKCVKNEMPSINTGWKKLFTLFVGLGVVVHFSYIGQRPKFSKARPARGWSGGGGRSTNPKEEKHLNSLSLQILYTFRPSLPNGGERRTSAL